jgi:transposase
MRQKTKMHMLQELVRLHRLGTSARTVARRLQMSRNTARNYREALAKAGLLEGEPGDLPDLETLKAALPVVLPPQQVSSIDEMAEEVDRMLKRNAGPRAIYDHLRIAKTDFRGSYWAMKRLCRRLQKQRPVEPEDVAIPVDTDAGEEAQVDFGYVGMMWDPEQKLLRKAWIFVMVLCYSRHQFARIVFDQKSTTWLRLHAEAFSAFGGVPKVIVPDNLKAAVVRAAFGLTEDPGLNRSYVELARHYGFQVDPTPPADPEKKGKAEAGVKYAKRNFMKPREKGEDVTAANRDLDRWVREIAGTRSHGTTGRKPIEVFEQEEREKLLPLPPLGFVPVIWKKAKIHTDCCVAFEKRLYSVPWHLRGEAWIKATPETVYIYVGDERVAEHSRRGPEARSINPAHLPEGREELRHRGRSYWEQQGSDLGDEVGAWVRERFEAADVLSPLRQVQAVVSMLGKYPKERANNACRRARHFGVDSYQGVRDILRKALDFDPLPELLLTPPEPPPKPKYARSISEILLPHTWNSHDLN